jgi:DNA polymerase-3 subunit delta
MAVVKPTALLALLGGRRDTPQVVLIHGADHGAAQDLSRKVVHKVLGAQDDAMNLVHLTEQQLSSARERLHEEFAALSMFGDKRVIWISGAGEATARQLEAILAEGTAGNLILVDAEALPKTSKLRKLCEADGRSASVALYEETPHELRLRLEQQIAASGLSIDEDAMVRLLELASFDRAVSESETQKLTLYCHGQQKITLEDVEAICGDTSEASGDDTIDAVFEGRLHDVDHMTTLLAASGATYRSGLSAILAHVVKLQGMAAQVIQGSGVEAVVAHPRNAIFFKRRAAVIRQLRSWNLEALFEAERKTNQAILLTRRRPELEDAITNRTLLALARTARNQRE